MHARSISALISLLLLACGGSDSKPAKPGPAVATGQAPAAAKATTSSMLVFGQAATFASTFTTADAGGVHVIVEVALLQQKGSFDAALFAKPHPTGYHTLEFENFDVAELKNVRFRFPATLYAGHYQAQDRVKVGSVVVEVKRVVIHGPIETSGDTAPVYRGFVFGDMTSAEYYMAHQPGPGAVFDQIVLIAEGALSGNPAWSSGTALEATAHPDQPLERYGQLSLQVGGTPLVVKTRAVYTSGKP